MPFFTDQLLRTIELPVPPRRIVSLVPSQTELLYDLGLEQEVASITKFCVHPPHWFRSKPRIGGTKQVSIEKVKALRPDLILANKEENVREQVEALSAIAPVWVSDVNGLEDALDMIKAVGRLTGTDEKAAGICHRVKTGFEQLPAAAKTVRAAYLIWREPHMAAGGDTFISDMLQRLGADNIFGHLQRYPVITADDLREANCDLLLLSSEPYPFRQKHIDEWQAQLPHAKILLVDGEMFSWYGSRLLQAPAYFAALQKRLTANL